VPGLPQPVVSFWTPSRRAALLLALASGLVVFLLWLPVGSREALFRALYGQRWLAIMLIVFGLVAVSLLWAAGQRLDARLFSLFNMQRYTPRWLDWVMWFFTQLGNMVAAFVGAAILYLLDYRILAIEIAIGTLTLWWVVEAVKFFAYRRRPFLVVEGARVVGGRERGRSFPSGHTSQAFLLATVLLHRFDLGLGGALALYGLALLVGFTRMYLGAHYPRDVIAGALLGSIWGTVAALVDAAWLGTGG
jgi:membrane-associated phospholipid phosphatase